MCFDLIKQTLTLAVSFLEQILSLHVVIRSYCLTKNSFICFFNKFNGLFFTLWSVIREGGEGQQVYVTLFRAEGVQNNDNLCYVINVWPLISRNL